jgi:hypothetical protein
MLNLSRLEICPNRLLPFPRHDLSCWAIGEHGEVLNVQFENAMYPKVSDRLMPFLRFLFLGESVSPVSQNLG